jgi:hypothetical protein
VTDTGVGIPTDLLPHIFDPFFTTKEKGTGLGMAIAHRIVEDHQGAIEVSSRVGEGTTFTLTLPVQATAAELSGGAPRSATGAIASGRTAAPAPAPSAPAASPSAVSPSL